MTVEAPTTLKPNPRTLKPRMSTASHLSWIAVALAACAALTFAIVVTALLQTFNELVLQASSWLAVFGASSFIAGALSRALVQRNEPEAQRARAIIAIAIGLAATGAAGIFGMDLF